MVQKRKKSTTLNIPPCSCGGQRIADGGTLRIGNNIKRYVTCEKCGTVSTDVQSANVKMNSFPILERGS